MSIFSDDYWRGRVGQECRRICEIVDLAEREEETPDWQLLRHHVQALSQAYVEADLTDEFAADLARAIGNSEAERTVSTESYRVIRQAAETF